MILFQFWDAFCLIFLSRVGSAGLQASVRKLESVDGTLYRSGHRKSGCRVVYSNPDIAVLLNDEPACGIPRSVDREIPNSPDREDRSAGRDGPNSQAELVRRFDIQLVSGRERRADAHVGIVTELQHIVGG